jgi:5'(3')-deoxyribonucleotidase
MRRLRLGIDLDGVVADFNTGWITRYNREFATELQPTQVTSWDGLVPLTHFADMDDFWHWARSGTPTVFGDLPCYDGACDTLQQLARHHRVVVVSSKPNWAIPDTLRWLAEHRMPSREIHFVWDKTAVPCDVYLEDAPHNLEALVTSRPESLVCRMVRPWNEPVPGARDVRSWTEFAECVTSVAQPAPEVA